jgi:D-xylose transport system ATP-binding protein
MDDYILEMRDITKEFPGVKALDNVSFKVKRGEIHALCGENGAGKSTLMKVLSGVYPSKTYSGDIVINGKVMEFEDIRASEKAGIAIIYQELALVKELDVAENIYLGNLSQIAGVVQWNKVYFDAGKLLEEIGLGSLEIDLGSKIKDIGIGHQQLVEIAKAFSKKADILILDEPTAALTENEVELLMKILRKLRGNGVTCILISHKLNELFAISDRITILRDGNSIGTFEIPEVDEEKVISLMVGRKLTQRYPEKGGHKIGEVVLSVKGYCHYSAEDRSKKVLDNINFNVHSGEILGMAGLMGAGRTELLSSLFGFLKGYREGEILVFGRKVVINSPLAAIRYGIGMVTEDRKRYGLVLMQSVKENVTLASLGEVARMGVISEFKEISETNLQVKNLNIKTPTVETAVNTLSGGNQQKILLARCLMTKPRLLFLDEPTRGIDVGAKYEIYLLMKKLAENGTAIMMASSELPEIIGMSDRVIVMHEGEISGEFAHGDITQEAIMRKASGGKAS